MEDLLNSIGWLLSIATAVGNGFAIFLVAKNRRLHSSANWFVLSLAVADFGVGITVFPSHYFCIHSMACNSRVYMAFFWFFLHSSVTNLCSLTWDRYIAIVHPFKYNTSMTERRPGMIILAAWLVPFTISLSLFVGMHLTNSSTALKNSTYRMSPPNSAAPQLTFVTQNSSRRQTDGVTQQQGTGQAVNPTNSVSVPSNSFLKHSVDSITSSFYAVSNAGSSFSLGSNSAPGSAFQGQGSFGLEPFSSSQLSFGSMTNPFSPTRSFFNHTSTMGSFV